MKISLEKMLLRNDHVWKLIHKIDKTLPVDHKIASVFAIPFYDKVTEYLLDSPLVSSGLKDKLVYVMQKVEEFEMESELRLLHIKNILDKVIYDDVDENNRDCIR